MDQGTHQDDHVALDDVDAHPLVVLVANIEEARAVEDVADLLILVQVPSGGRC